MSATFGERLRVTVFGQSHSEAMGAVVDGLPPGCASIRSTCARFWRAARPDRGR